MMHFLMCFNRPIIDIIKIVQAEVDALFLFVFDLRKQSASENGEYEIGVLLTLPTSGKEVVLYPR